MTDQPDSSSPPESPSSPQPQTYWVCAACGCQVHHETDSCPECGAYPGEDQKPASAHHHNLTLAILLLVLLAAALIGLSRGAAEAREAEETRFRRLRPDEKAMVVVPTPLPRAIPTPLPWPTPTPPTPTPVPRPTPTPIPFRPEDFAATPTPRPPPPQVEPTPEPRPQSILERKDRFAAEFREELNRTTPMAKEGEFIRIVLLDGRAISGTIERLEVNQIGLVLSSGRRWVQHKEMQQESRLRVDNTARESWVEERALEAVLRPLNP